MFVNDLFSDGAPAAGEPEKWKKTVIGNQVSIGTNATILPVHICDRVVIGAGAVVTKDITQPASSAPSINQNVGTAEQYFFNH